MRNPHLAAMCWLAFVAFFKKEKKKGKTKNEGGSVGKAGE
jgi:hypothetical protein